MEVRCRISENTKAGTAGAELIFWRWLFDKESYIRPPSRWGMALTIAVLAVAGGPEAGRAVATAANSDWSVVCTVKGAEIIDVERPLTNDLEQAGEVWIRLYGAEPPFAVMRMPACNVTVSKAGYFGPDPHMSKLAENMRDMGMESDEFSWNFDFGTQASWVLGGPVAVGGAVLFEKYDAQTKATEYWHASGTDADPAPVPALADRWDEFLTISPDGSRVAWMHRQHEPLRNGRENCGRETMTEILVQTIATGELEHIPLAASLDRSSLVFMEPDGGFTLSNNSMTADLDSPYGYRPDVQRLLGIDRSGKLTWGPVDLPIRLLEAGSVRRIKNGWVVWDSMSDFGGNILPDAVAWSLTAGEGRFELPPNMRVASVSVAPGGQLIAVTVAPSFQSGSTAGEMLVLQSDDGVVAFRKTVKLGLHQSTNDFKVTFLGANHLAVGLRGRIEVLEVPEYR